VVTEHSAEAWALPPRDFQEVGQCSIFYLEEGLVRSGSTEMEDYILDEKRIQEMIASRADLSTCSVLSITYWIFKAAKRKHIAVLKPVIKISIQYERVMTIWKEARTTVLGTKGTEMLLRIGIRFR
jgi:hypothetical protein